MPSKKKRGASGETFEIVTVADFMKVPRHRLGKCLKEFRACLDMTHDMDAAFKAVARAQGINPADAKIRLCERFEWIDDDLGEIKLTINTGAKPEATSPAEAPLSDPRSSQESET